MSLTDRTLLRLGLLVRLQVLTEIRLAIKAFAAYVARVREISLRQRNVPLAVHPQVVPRSEESATDVAGKAFCLVQGGVL